MVGSYSLVFYGTVVFKNVLRLQVNLGEGRPLLGVDGRLRGHRAQLFSV